MRLAWLGPLLVLPALAQGPPASGLPRHGGGLSLGTGFSAAPLLVDGYYTSNSGIGIYLGGGGTPHPGSQYASWDLNFNQRGTLRETQAAAYLGVAVTRHPALAWGLGFGRHVSGWEIDRSGWFTAEELARADTSTVRQGLHGWLACYPGRFVGFQGQAGPGWVGVSLALRFW
jgi:hypothetical protein